MNEDERAPSAAAPSIDVGNSSKERGLLETSLFNSGLRRAIGVILFIGAISFGWLWVNQTAPSPVVTNEDIVNGWGQAISRFGITPIFPPQEDVFVGDVWASIDYDPTAQPSQIQNVFFQTFLGRSIKIGHIDLMTKNHISESFSFSETTAIDGKIDFRQKREIKVSGTGGAGILKLSIIALPGINITSIDNRNMEAGAASRFGLNKSRTNLFAETTLIPIVETYGADIETAVAELIKWCVSPEHATSCSDEYLRHLMRYVFGNKLITDATPIVLKVVTRAYMTRSLQQTRTKFTSDQSGAKVSVLPAFGHMNGEIPAPNGAEGKAGDAKNTLASNAVNQNSYGISDQLYPVPIVIGVRTISADTIKQTKKE